MTVAELIEALRKLPQHKLVELEANTDTGDCDVARVYVQGDVVVISTVLER